MTQMSKRRLDKDVEKRMFFLFWRSLTRLGSPAETAEFFSDLLTSTEEMMLTKRYTTAILLAKGYSPTYIRQTLNVSFTTTNTVAAWLKNLKPATKKIIAAHLRDEAWSAFFDKIDALLDSIHRKILLRSAKNLLR